MSDISEVYGKNYNSESVMSRIQHALNVVIQNLLHRQFIFGQKSDVAWDGHNMKPEAKSHIKTMVETTKIYMGNTPEYTLNFINKQDKRETSMLQFLIDGGVEYFYILDNVRGEMYILYITTEEVNLISSSIDVQS